MVDQTEVRDRRVMAIIAAVAGVLCFTVLPVGVVRAMDAVLEGAAAKIQASGNQLISTAPKIVITLWPIWGGLCIAAGVALLYVAWSIYRGEIWARPLAIGLLAIPAIAGAYFSGPIMFFAKSAIKYFVVIALIGLIPYFAILLWGRMSRSERWARFFVFLFLGVVAAWNFGLGGSSLRMFMARTEPYDLTNGQYGFLMGIPAVWTGVLMVIISIPLLAAYSRLGYRIAVVGLLVNLVAGTVLYATNPGTTEFLAGMILAAITLTLLFTPSVVKALVKKEHEEERTDKSQEIILPTSP